MKPASYLLEEQFIMLYPKLAKLLGIDGAAMLQQLHFLLNGKALDPKSNKYNFVDGRWWVYNTYEEWQSHFFIWLSKRSIQRSFLKLEELGIVLSMQSVKYASDRTKWYAIDYEAWGKYLDENINKPLPEDSGDKESADDEHQGSSLIMPNWNDGSCQIGTMKIRSDWHDDSSYNPIDSQSKKSDTQPADAVAASAAHTVTNEGSPSSVVGADVGGRPIIKSRQQVARENGRGDQATDLRYEGEGEDVPSPLAVYIVNKVQEAGFEKIKTLNKNQRDRLEDRVFWFNPESEQRERVASPDTMFDSGDEDYRAWIDYVIVEASLKAKRQNERAKGGKQYTPKRDDIVARLRNIAEYRAWKKERHKNDLPAPEDEKPSATGRDKLYL